MIGQSYFPENFSMLGSPIASVPLNPNAPNFTTTVGMQSLLQALASSTREFEAAAYNPTIENSPYNSNFDAPNSFQPQFPAYSPFGLESDPYFSGMGGGQGLGFGQMGQTNPFFNADFASSLGGFFGGNTGGHWTESETIGQNGQPTSIAFAYAANPQQPQAGSLAGADVWGDPHIKDANGGTQNFSSPNGLFLNANGSAVLTEASASNKTTNDVQIYAPGQESSIDADPTQTQVYEQVNGNMVDLGSAASLGIGYDKCNKGYDMSANQTVNIGDGVTVNWDPSNNSTVTFGSAPQCPPKPQCG